MKELNEIVQRLTNIPLDDARLRMIAQKMILQCSTLIGNKITPDSEIINLLENMTLKLENFSLRSN